MHKCSDSLEHFLCIVLIFLVWLVVTGKLPFLVSLLVLAAQRRPDGAPAFSPTATQAAQAVAEEVWWLFAFLTAKEEAAVNVCMTHSLVQVGGIDWSGSYFFFLPCFPHILYLS